MAVGSRARCREMNRESRERLAQIEGEGSRETMESMQKKVGKSARVHFFFNTQDTSAYACVYV